MHAHKLQVTVPEDHGREIAVRLPDDFPSGPAEVIVITDSQSPDLRSPQPRTTIEKLRSFHRTSEEDKVLDDFDAFRREHPFRLDSLSDEP
jgi:hypothetical protein